MAKRKVTSEDIDTVVAVKEVAAPTKPFWEQYQRPLLYGLAAILVLAAAWWGYKNLIVAPKQKEAVSVMWQAQQQFERDSFKMALENPGGGFDGFLTIIDKYGSTPAGNAAKYYAGVCYLQMGDFDNARKYIEDFSPTGDLLPIMKYGILGDIYSEQKDMAKAADMYEKAVDAGNNDVLAAMYLKRLGLLHEYQGNKDAARKAYERLHRDFADPQSVDWRESEKLLYRVQ